MSEFKVGDAVKAPWGPGIVTRVYVTTGLDLWRGRYKHIHLHIRHWDAGRNATTYREGLGASQVTRASQSDFVDAIGPEWRTMLSRPDSLRRILRDDLDVRFAEDVKGEEEVK